MACRQPCGRLRARSLRLRATLDELRKTGPDRTAVEFGPDLAVDAGSMITKASASSRARVTMTWQRSRPGAAEGVE
ncbi:CU044_2847 family protein [Streptomyces echinatus]|uniref:CU044_2847 family protein n=1 Tax=Streptomyces echinatus TaxID=67293 RepID=UPI001CECF39C|nr:CU044_2847 family protein [Streptomyces echinatus]